MSVIPKRRRRKAEINIVPLVDVLVVLIFFFLVSMQFRNLTLLNLTLPKIETAGKEKPAESLQIGVFAQEDDESPALVSVMLLTEGELAYDDVEGVATDAGEKVETAFRLGHDVAAQVVANALDEL